MHFTSKTSIKCKCKKTKLNPLFLKGVLKHTLVSHVPTTLLNTAVIIATRHCSSILQLNAEPPRLEFHIGNHVRFDHAQKRKGREIGAGEKSLFQRNPRKPHIKISCPRFTRHSGSALCSVNILSPSQSELKQRDD